ncbi:AraC family transcriptional regulator [Roseomonas sp. ACRSG]|nr:AraC family transcriptional regulator [Roseomonas sp. ACRSG]
MATTQPLPGVQNRQLSPGLEQDLSELLRHARDLLGHDQRAAALLLDRAAQLLPAPASLPARPGGLAPWQVLRLTRYVEAHLDRQILQKDLAAEVRLSSGHLARSFRRSFGCTPHAYVMEQRVGRAKALMARTDMPLCEIAIGCGLADQAHLSRLFRRLVGSTPLAWRRQHQPAPRGGAGAGRIRLVAEDGGSGQDCFA